jgi:hypothetical protein
MKLFKIDETKLYEKYFSNMTVGQFFSLDSIPKDVDEHHMHNIGEFLKKVKAENEGVDVDNMTISNIITNLYLQSVENGEVD